MEKEYMSDFAEALFRLCETFHGDDMPIEQAIYVGVSFFSSMAHDCAPNQELARNLIEHAAYAGKEMSEGCDAETIRH